MKRVNYLLTWTERYAGVALPSSVAPALRMPLVTLAAALALVGSMWGVQETRLRAAERDGAAYARRIAAIELDVARVRALQRDVVWLRALTARVAEIRRSGTRHAGEIATLGNRLPADAWLTSLRADRAALALEGRGARLATVGSALDAFAQLPEYAGARLVAVHGDPQHAGVTYAIALEPRR